ncbi:AFR695Cp [Eremothecium gossypii ATCC 10895]|uniref:AFR695Cp n=1 Tax=Eremothecium gossypii (strain ATCC 10895 / CBS 109.51 / FGSC 9923 / NRRL Y-1056) TaxID=284811 RepID=Q751Y0_EREGS|nr:AFR695Cp [Eremothecium gossypii ATCC 10895]AAS54067.1 AFR695Cp [Eremothecium gossypii ATCC 10895]AEY98382.1 FAFR695Cp [Eremothecium gossypii FDAG1]
MADLPSLNSTTSLSDNVALRNYYDNLLFRNNSGKSLTDLARKGGEEGEREERPQMDFINGFRSPGFAGDAATSASSRPATAGPGSYRTDGRAGSGQAYGSLLHHKHMFSLGVGYEPGTEAASAPPSLGQLQYSYQPMMGLVQHQGSPAQSRDNSLTMGSAVSPMAMGGVYGSLAPHGLSANSTLYQASSAGNNGLGGYLPQEPHGFASTRRSSYISDQLIHGHQQSMPMQHLYDSSCPAGNALAFHSQHSSHMQPTQGGQSQAQQQGQSQPRSQSQPQPQAQSQVHNIQRSRPPYPQKHASVPQINYSAGGAVSTSGAGDSCSSATKVGEQQGGTFPLDNGLVLCNGLIVSSSDLRQLYRSSSGHYFSALECFKFIDNIKDILLGDRCGTASGSSSRQREMILKFVGFLKSCNLNYNPQSDAFVSSSQHRRSSTSSYLHYKPLVLVALKNGKLELLSLPQSTNLNMAREDLVIIDGDRGKDLAMVIEPKVDIDLALFINFLKKKIHFDSLITAVDQHYPNEHFIQALMDSTNNGSGKDELNHKLYDVIELTQLIIPSKQVLRFATPWEVSTNLHSKFQDELKALHIAQLKLKTLNNGTAASGGSVASAATQGAPSSASKSASHSSASAPGNSQSARSLNIKILNAEFQFDRKKLTFYYVCQERNDFRELIKELFKFYKTRIWLCAIPNNLGVDKKYYDEHKKEWAMYQEMMKHYANEDLVDTNMQGGFIVAPPLHEIELDNFQLGVYKELVTSMFP